MKTKRSIRLRPALALRGALGHRSEPDAVAVGRRLALVVALAAVSAAAGCQPEPATPPPATAPRAPTATAARIGDASDWCAGHGLPESQCTKCNPGLVAGFQASGDWCAAHGFPESVCPLCNPMTPPSPAGVAATRVGDASDWCAEHGLPESHCSKCDPTTIARFQASGDWCPEHGFPESVCPVCNPMTPPPGPGADGVAPGTRVRFRSPDHERAVGIATVPAVSGAQALSVETTARVVFNQDAVADVRSAVPGIVRTVAVELGQRVAAGDALFTLESAHVGDLQARRHAARGQVDAARANLARQRKLRQDAIASEREVEVARQELQAANAELAAIDQALRLSGAARGGDAGRFTVHAPIAGWVVRRPAVVGTFADAPESLATIADTTTMWAISDVPEWDAGSMRLGQPVEVRVDGVPGQTFRGSLDWLAAEVDPRTRTVAARTAIANPDGLLRAGQFARASIAVAAARGATAVPVDALQRVGAGAVVFVRTAPGVYEARNVRPGRSDGRSVQVDGAIAPGDAVVTTGAFLLRTELSRESIGAGCCEVDGPGGD